MGNLRSEIFLSHSSFLDLSYRHTALLFRRRGYGPSFLSKDGNAKRKDTPVCS